MMDIEVNQKKTGMHLGRRIVYLILSVFSLATCALSLFLPCCAYAKISDEGTVSSLVSISPIQFNDALQYRELLVSGVAYIVLGVFLLWIAVMVSLLLLSLLSLRGFIDKNEEAQAKGVKSMLFVLSFYTIFLFFGGVILGAVNQGMGGRIRSADNVWPMILAIVIDCAYALLRGFVEDQKFLKCENDPRFSLEARRLRKVSKAARLELFIFSMIISVISVVSLLVDIFTIKVDFRGEAVYTIRVSGWRFIRNYATLTQGERLVSFLLFTMVFTMSMLMLLSIVGFFSRSKWFYKFSLSSTACGALFCFLVGIFGKYYEIVQKMNEWSMLYFVRFRLGTDIQLSDIFSYKISSMSFWFFIGLMGVLVVLVARHPFTKGNAAEKILERYEHDTTYQNIYGEVAITDISVNSPENLYPLEGANDSASVEEEKAEVEEEEKAELQEPEAVIPSKPIVEDSDPCPAFSELDGKTAEFAREMAWRRTRLFQDPTLPKIVQFVVNYARDSRLHLSYTQEDIAAFIAGLGMSKLTILQGMSGTGKTSLPKIFTEALCSRCEIIEVESSWRDKSELLGYYNEFSKMYTPKKFTQALYRATLNPDVMTFIVLDEMNLSRIEYYFSDFLSLMEHEAFRRELKLLNIGIFKYENGEKIDYRGLSDGHTIKIPKNIWFIGTANRDESTFEISDKVYDRAHTMNFNKRAPKILYYNEPILPEYLPVDVLDRLFEKAKADMKFNIDAYPAIAEVEKLLAPYNISFGNRVANQIETFVSIYCACFSASDAVIHDAVETILLSKIVSKLELKSLDNKEQLIAEFERLQFYRCSSFIEKLHED